MGRTTTLSPLGLYRWDDTIFDLMQIPSALDKPTLIDNLLSETAELEVLYTNPVVFKNLVGVWSAKQLDIWNRLYATTQYEYNPIENYNRYETGSEGGTGSTTHSGTDTTADTTTYGGTDGRTEAIMQGGSDTNTRQMAEGGTEGENTTSQMAQGGTDTVTRQMAEGGTQGESTTNSMAEGGSTTITKQVAEGGTQGETTTAQMAQGGQDVVTGADTKGHWIAGFNSAPSGQDDGLVKQTRDQDDATTTTAYGKTESDNGSKTTTFGKTESESDTTAYGKTENVTEQRTYGQTIQKAGNMTHGEQIATTNTGSHELHAHGNIGITTTQKLIREQRDIDLFNLYDIIIEDFKMRFCILIY